MCSSQPLAKPILAALGLLLLGFQDACAAPREVSLNAEPVRCVALYQGQVCHFNARLQWAGATPGDYCLFRADGAEPLICWQQASRGYAAIAMQSADTVKFELRARGSTAVLAATSIEIAWVYDARRRAKSSWRLF